MPSPLFKNASASMRQALMSEFRRTNVGRMVSEVQRIKAGGGDPLRLKSLLRGFNAAAKPETILRQMLGTDWGDLVAGVVRYGKREDDAGKLIRALLEALGPAGKILSLAIEATQGPSEPNVPRELAMGIRLLQAFGYEVLPPAALRGTPAGKRGAAAARQYLEDLGYQIVSPEEAEEKRKAQEAAARPEPYVSVQMSSGKQQRFRSDNPMVSGEWIEANSSNVHSFRYDHEQADLYVRFLATQKGGNRSGPGPVYRYNMVQPELFTSLRRANSKGGWVWDHLRIRGTVSGHQKDYQLVELQADGYVPRKATMTPVGEFYATRHVKTAKGFQKSTLPPESVRPYQPIGPIPPHMKHLFGY